MQAAGHSSRYMLLSLVCSIVALAFQPQQSQISQLTKLHAAIYNGKILQAKSDFFRRKLVLRATTCIPTSGNQYNCPLTTLVCVAMMTIIV